MASEIAEGLGINMNLLQRKVTLIIEGCVPPVLFEDTHSEWAYSLPPKTIDIDK